MTDSSKGRVAILYPGDRDARRDATAENGRFTNIFEALGAMGLPAVQNALGIETERLPVLWDCDFLLGPRTEAGEDTYVLCEINVSCVAPYPESAVPYIAEAIGARLGITGV